MSRGAAATYHHYMLQLTECPSQPGCAQEVAISTNKSWFRVLQQGTHAVMWQEVPVQIDPQQPGSPITTGALKSPS